MLVSSLLDFFLSGNKAPNSRKFLLSLNSPSQSDCMTGSKQLLRACPQTPPWGSLPPTKRSNIHQVVYMALQAVYDRKEVGSTRLNKHGLDAILAGVWGGSRNRNPAVWELGSCRCVLGWFSSLFLNQTPSSQQDSFADSKGVCRRIIMMELTRSNSHSAHTVSMTAQHQDVTMAFRTQISCKAPSFWIIHCSYSNWKIFVSNKWGTLLTDLSVPWWPVVHPLQTAIPCTWRQRT